MKPNLLKIKGLNSYLKQQTIDFSKIMQFGIFGIFGNTGSGKSTILDAITLCLYGKISRHDERGNGQFINTNADSAYLHFEFLICDEKYVIERTYKIKNNDGVKTVNNTVAKFYKFENNEILMLEEGAKRVEQKVIQILGISYEDFIKTVILPQGKFSDFLLLSNEKRKSMLERIFSLERYGENFRINIKNNMDSLNKIIDDCKNKLQIYGTFDKLDLEELELKLENLKAINTQQIAQYDENSKKLREQQEDFKKFKEYKKYQHEYNILMKDEHNIENSIKNLKKSNTALDILKSLDAYNKAKTQKENLISNIKQQEKDLKNLDNELDFYNLEYDKKINKNEEDIIKSRVKAENLENSIKKQQQNIELIKNIENLEKLYNQNQKNQEINSNFIKELKIKKNEFLENQKILEEKENNLEISFEYKQKINYCYEICQKYKNLKKDFQEKSQSINSCLEYLEINKNNLKILEQKSQSIDFKKVKLDDDFSKFEINQTSEKSKINLEESKRILEKNLEIYNENISNIQAIERKIEIFENELKNLEFEQNNLKNTLENSKNELKNKNEDYIEFQMKNSINIICSNLKKGDLCPICNNIIILETDKLDDFDIDKIKKQMQNIESTIERNNNLLNSTKDEINKKSFEIYQSLISLHDLYTQDQTINYKDNIRKMQIIETRYQNIHKYEKLYLQQKQNYEENLAKILSKKENLEQNKKNLQAEVYHLSETEKKLKIDISDLKQELDKISQILIKKLNEISKDFNNSFIIEIIEEKKEALNLDEQKLEEYKNQQKFINKNLFELDKNIEQKTLENNSFNINLEKLKVEIKMQKQNFYNFENEIKSCFGNENLSLLLEDENKKIREYEEHKNDLTQKIQKNVNKKQKLQENYNKERTDFEVCKSICLDKKTEFENKLKQHNFVDISELNTYVIPLEDQNKIQTEVEMFLKQKNNLEKYLEIHLEMLKNIDFENIDFKKNIEQYENKCQALQVQIDDNKSEIAVIKEKINNFKENEIQIKQINQDLKKSTQQCDILAELNSVISGKKFVEFLAKKQMDYISKEASVRLRNMTKGKYSLILDNTDFIIREDQNGGATRKPNTLSGGEIFIVSLCLALALSSKIQLKSKNSLEFFFLDEGFGTLDENKLKDVINCLESLKLENICIGIITHSNLLKEYIQSKILVKEDDDYLEGSKITVEI